MMPLLLLPTSRSACDIRNKGRTLLQPVGKEQAFSWKYIKMVDPI
ncbi:hypothetical protein [Paenibacillus sp. Soil522]|nr:hypothetical protein [Paenibacillus sp. Soil522]